MNIQPPSGPHSQEHTPGADTGSLDGTVLPPAEVCELGARARLSEVGGSQRAIVDLATTAQNLAGVVEELESRVFDLQQLVRTTIAFHAQVQMDSPEDKALHARAVEALSVNARLLGVDL